MAGTYNDQYLPKSWFKTLGRLTEVDFQEIIANDPRCSGNGEGYPVFAFVRYLNGIVKGQVDLRQEAERKVREIEKESGKRENRLSKDVSKVDDKLLKTEAKLRETKEKLASKPEPLPPEEKDPEEVALDKKERELKNKINEEKYLSLKIANQMKAKLLVAKVDAENRIVATLTATSSMIQNTVIPNSANDISQESFKGKVRAIIEIMTSNYRKAVDILSDSADNVSWDDDSDSDLLRERLTKIADADPDFQRHFDGIYNEK